ncbi:MAG: SIMPL domain-containing protein [Chloroflexi bacterium]|nr:SIMPL domain-containing protein [Chloroflexota bacterium]
MLQRGPLWLAAVALSVIALVLAMGTTNRGLAATTNSVVVSANQPTGIVVSGEGKVSVVPDIALVTLGIEARARTVEEARDQAARAMDAVMQSLAKNGVDKKDIQTRALNIHPEWRDKRFPDSGEGPEIVGYIVSNQISIKIRNLKQVTTTVDGAIAAGGDATRMQGISFGLDDPEAAMTQARDEAVADAKAKAEQLARLSGVSVGRPIHLSDTIVSQPPFGRIGVAVPAARMADEAMSTPIEPGQTEVRVVVQATYAIE